MTRRKRPPPTPPKIDRRAPTKEPYVRLYLFVEGQTEKGWATWLHQTFRTLRVEILCSSGRGGGPNVLLELAKDKLRTLPRGSRDEVWLVFDDDGRSDVSGTLHEACDAGLGVVFSNACFELWPLLHLGDTTRAEDAGRLQTQLHAAHPTYDHDSGAHVDWSVLADASEGATSRARLLHRRAEEAGDPLGCPSTTAWLLHARCAAGAEVGDLFTDFPDPLRSSLERMLPRTLRRSR